MKNIVSYIQRIALMLIIPLVFCACPSEIDDPKEEIKGCMDRNSLEYNAAATVDDGSCRYSKVTFYARYSAFNNIPIMRIDLSVDGETIGSIQTTYPNGPGNCSAVGTVLYEFQNSKTVDWNTIVYLASGAVVYGSGTVSPSRYSECIKINVTQ
ncbi:MAG: hypothetical protein LBR66_00675 [Candidatus Symbiothrix sp.]|nr:hypothetical protein [Candidatus Symbiothrix sp.]